MLRKKPTRTRFLQSAGPSFLCYPRPVPLPSLTAHCALRPSAGTMPHNAHKTMLISRCKRENHIWEKVNELAQLCETKVFVCIEDDLGANKYKPNFVYHSHPDSNFPLSWTEMVSPYAAIS